MKIGKRYKIQELTQEGKAAKTFFAKLVATSKYVYVFRRKVQLGEYNISYNKADIITSKVVITEVDKY